MIGEFVGTGLNGRNKIIRFEIIGSLESGFGVEKKTHEISEVIAAHHVWQERSRVVLNVTIDSTTLSCGGKLLHVVQVDFAKLTWKELELASPDSNIHSSSGPGWICAGTLGVDERTLDKTWNIVKSMAEFITRRLGNTCVWVAVGDEESWCSFRDYGGNE